jgi:hypothetical protein
MKISRAIFLKKLPLKTIFINIKNVDRGADDQPGYFYTWPKSL